MRVGGEPLVRVEHVSKKYCRSLKHSLWYGLRDLGAELLGQSGDDRLRLRRDEFLAIDDVSFELRRGECLGLIGANGAGKSTLLKMLNGLVRPDAGRIEIHGRVGALIELGAGFNPILTGRENVYVNGAVLGLTKKEVVARFDEIVEFSGLHEFIDSPVQSYSSGMRVRLGFAVAAHLDPDLLLIDEVLAVGDASFRAKCIARINELSRRAAILFVSHQMALVARVASRVLVLNGGRAARISNDVPFGIESYLETLPPPPRLAMAGGPINSLSLALRSEGPATHASEPAIDSGDSLSSIVTFRSSLPVEKAYAELLITDLEGRPVAQCDSREVGFDLNWEIGNASFEVTLPRLLLARGRYFLALHLFESNAGAQVGNLLHSERNLASFTIRDGALGFAPLRLEARWSSR